MCIFEIIVGKHVGATCICVYWFVLKIPCLHLLRKELHVTPCSLEIYVSLGIITQILSLVVQTLWPHFHFFILSNCLEGVLYSVIQQSTGARTREPERGVQFTYNSCSYHEIPLLHYFQVDTYLGPRTCSLTPSHIFLSCYMWKEK